jgi:hypothetical protein
MQTLRNVAIIAVLALAVAVLPAGGTAADVALELLLMGFLVAIGLFAYRIYLENQLTLSTLSDARRAILYGACGVIALMIVGTDELTGSGTGVLVWVGLIGLSAFAIVRVWTDAQRYP